MYKPLWRKKISGLILLIIVLTVYGCLSEEIISPAPPDYSIPETRWAKYENNPVLDIGRAGSWDDYSVAHPFVVQGFDGIYRMWYSGYDGTTWRIGYATSPDGIKWTKYGSNPVLDIGLKGAWDDFGVRYQTVLKDADGSYKMWYTGYDKTHTYVPTGIGYAISTDGIKWSKYTKNPILVAGPPGSWDNVSVATPNIIKEPDGRYKMWYTGSAGGRYSIGYAASANGIKWIKHPEPVLKGGYKYISVTVPDVIRDADGIYKMWFTGDLFDMGMMLEGDYSAFDTAEICYAYSTDGINWTKYDYPEPLFVPGHRGSWDALRIDDPNVIKCADGTYKMWYGGVDRNNCRIGLVTSR